MNDLIRFLERLMIGESNTDYSKQHRELHNNTLHQVIESLELLNECDTLLQLIAISFDHLTLTPQVKAAINELLPKMVKAFERSKVEFKGISVSYEEAEKSYPEVTYVYSEFREILVYPDKNGVYCMGIAVGKEDYILRVPGTMSEVEHRGTREAMEALLIKYAKEEGIL